MFSDSVVGGNSSSDEDEPRATSSSGHHDDSTSFSVHTYVKVDGLTRSVEQSKTTTVSRYRQPTRFNITYLINRQFIIKLLAWWFATFIDWFK
jgi:hypothetical protein